MHFCEIIASSTFDVERYPNGEFEPALNVPAPNLQEHKYEPLPICDDFDCETLKFPYQTMRVPLDEKILTFKERKSFLRLYGRDSLHSKYTQALIARRQQSFCYTASTCMEYNPTNYHQMAGLICMYDTDNFFYLYVTRGEDCQKMLNIISSDIARISYPLGKGIAIDDDKPVYLKATVKNDQLHFSYAVGNDNYILIDKCFDYSILSDDYYMENGEYRFTGAFVGLCCQDCYNQESYADFDWFCYKEE